MNAQPLAALEGLCGDDNESLRVGLSIMDQGSQLRRNAFDSVPETDLLSWCDQQPITRYPAAASAVTPFQPGEGGRPQWTGTARKLLDKAPDRVSVLKRFVDQFVPAGSVRSQAAILTNNSQLLDDLADYPDTAVTQFVTSQKARLSQAIESQGELETRQGELESLIQWDRDERFEY